MTNEWLQSLNNFYCIFMLLIYPLIMRSAYYDISRAKLVAFYAISFIYIFSCLGIFIFMKIKKNALPLSNLTKAEKVWLGIGTVSILISFLLNGNYKSTLFGVYDYGSGALFLLTIIVTVFFLSLSGVNELIFCSCSAIALIITASTTILQFLNVSPTLEGTGGFFGTIGNRDLVGFYFVVMLPFCTNLISKKRWNILGCLGIFLGTIGIVVSNTDIAIIGFCLESTIIVAMLLKDAEKKLDAYIYTLVVGISLLSTFILRTIFTNTYEIGDIEILFSSPVISIPIIVLSVIGLWLHNNTMFNKTIWILAIIGCILISLYPVYIITFTILASPDNESLLRNGLYFDNHWGSGRGYIWRCNVYLFTHGGFVKQLFGHGAVSFYNDYMANQELFHEIYEPMYVGENLTNSHNIFLHMLYEYGIFGVVSMLGIAISALKRMVHSEPLFYKMKFVALIVAMVTGALIMSYNITMAFIPMLLI